MSILSKLFGKKEKSPTNTHDPLPLKFPVLMMDGSIENYDEHFIITDSIHCVVCQGKSYHTSFDCENLKWEMQNSDFQLRGVEIAMAKKQKMVYCAYCSRENYLYKHGIIETE